MEESDTFDERVPLYKQDRFWKGLFWLAIGLNVFTILTSNLGLDVHVENAYVESGDGWALEWGDVRTEDPRASDPSNAKEVPASSVTTGASMPFAVIGMIIAILIARRVGLEKETIIVLLLNPALIFSVGRGYSEYTYLAILGVVWAIWSTSKNYKHEKTEIARITAILIASIFTLWIVILKLKLEPMEMLIPLLCLTLIGILIDRVPDDWFQPQKTLISGFGLGLLSIVMLGVYGYGSFTVVTTDTFRFLQALPISIFGVIILYGLVGMVLWPFAIDTWKKMGDNEDRLTGELSLFIGILSGVIVAYVACLWTFESILWDSEWPWHMWTMGNNGRYITILAIPSYLLVKRVNGEINWTEKKAVMGVLLVLPLSLAAGLHGQTYWTDDAAEVLCENMEDHEDFLFVHDAALGMHYLYTFHTEINDVTERNITGHWRSPDSGWEDELFSNVPVENRGNLSSVEWIVLSPGIVWDSPEQGWYQTTGKADFMNGGGEWVIWTTHTEISIN